MNSIFSAINIFLPFLFLVCSDSSGTGCELFAIFLCCLLVVVLSCPFVSLILARNENDADW